MTVNQWQSGSTVPEITAFLAQSSKLFLSYVHYRPHKQSQQTNGAYPNTNRNLHSQQNVIPSDNPAQKPTATHVERHSLPFIQPGAYFLVQKIPSLVLIISHLNSLQNLLPRCCKIRFNTFTHSTWHPHLVHSIWSTKTSCGNSKIRSRNRNKCSETSKLR
jgi:hypothetical protein